MLSYIQGDGSIKHVISHLDQAQYEYWCKFIGKNLIEITGDDIEIVLTYTKRADDMLNTERSISREILGVYVYGWFRKFEKW